MKADSITIKWLINDSGISRYEISKATGVTEMTLSRLTNGVSKIENLPLKTAAALTEYAEKALNENLKMNTYLTPEGMEFVSNEEVYPSDNGEFVHVIAWPKELHQEDKYLLTFRANPDYRPGHDGPEEWSDWIAISAEYIGDYDAAVIKETSQLLKLNNGDVVRQSTWNGEKWYDNGKEYRPLYSYNYETNDSVISGIEIK